jgi:hypothetical protein
MDQQLSALAASLPRSWPLHLALVLLIPLWLPVLGVVLAYAILVARDPIETEPGVLEDDDGLPDDYVPPFVPPPRRTPARPPFAVGRRSACFLQRRSPNRRFQHGHQTSRRSC